MVVKRLGADFLQVTNNAGPDRIMLGMKFRNEADTSSFMIALEQSGTWVTIEIVKATTPTQHQTPDQMYVKAQC